MATIWNKLALIFMAKTPTPGVYDATSLNAEGELKVTDGASVGLPPFGTGSRGWLQGIYDKLGPVSSTDVENLLKDISDHTDQLEPHLAHLVHRSYHGHGSRAELPTYVQSTRQIETTILFNTEAPTSSPIPTNAAPWNIGVLLDQSDFVEQKLTFRANEGVHGNIVFSYAISATALPVVDSLPVNIDDGAVVLPLPLENVGPFFNAGFIPDIDSPPVTFAQLNLLSFRVVGPDLTRFETQTISPSDPLKVIRALIEPSLFGKRGILGAERSVFGEALFTERTAQVEYDFARTIAANRLTLGTPTGGATFTAVEAEGILATGAAVTSYHSFTTIKRSRYYPAKGIWAFFSARFALPTHVNSFQRIGPYVLDANGNGLHIGYEGLIFGVTHLRNGVRTFIPVTGFNIDKLNRRYGSRFTSAGKLVTFNPQARNVYQLRVGFLGSNIAELSCENPDGNLILLHVFRFPNNLFGSNFTDNRFQLTAEVSKTNADATILTIGSGSGALGSETSATGLEPSETHGREHVNAYATVAGTLTPTTGTVRVNNTGRRVIIKSLSVSYSKVLSAGGTIQITDGNGGPVKHTIELAASGSNTADSIFQNYPEGLQFDTSIFLSLPGLGAGANCSVVAVGYEEASPL